MNEPDREAEELLPWEANGTLDAAERASVARLLEVSGDARRQLEFWQLLRNGLPRGAEQVPDAGLGWRRLQQQMRREARSVRSPRWQAAIAAGILLVAALQLTILLRPHRESEVYLPLGSSPAVRPDEWRMQIRFVPAARVGDINELLGTLNARVVNGPSALGIYEVSVPRAAGFASADAVVERLGSDPLVQQVNAVP